PLNQSVALPTYSGGSQLLGIGRCERERGARYESGPVARVAVTKNPVYPIAITGCRVEAGVVQRGGRRGGIKIGNVAVGVGSLELEILRYGARVPHQSDGGPVLSGCRVNYGWSPCSNVSDAKYTVAPGETNQQRDRHDDCRNKN